MRVIIHGTGDKYKETVRVIIHGTGDNYNKTWKCIFKGGKGKQIFFFAVYIFLCTLLRKFAPYVRLYNNVSVIDL